MHTEEQIKEYMEACHQLIENMDSLQVLRKVYTILIDEYDQQISR